MKGELGSKTSISKVIVPEEYIPEVPFVVMLSFAFPGLIAVTVVPETLTYSFPSVIETVADTPVRIYLLKSNSAPLRNKAVSSDETNGETKAVALEAILPFGVVVVNGVPSLPQVTEALTSFSNHFPIKSSVGLGSFSFSR